MSISRQSYVPKQIGMQAMWLDEEFYFLYTTPKHWKINSPLFVNIEVEWQCLSGMQEYTPHWSNNALFGVKSRIIQSKSRMVQNESRELTETYVQGST